MLIFYIPIFWAFSWLVGIVGVYALSFFDLTDAQFESALPWLRGVSTIGGLYVCWVLHVLLKRNRANHAA